ncbi:MAG: (p)ppGpp synthetase [Spirochaetaceae bacterium]|nr:(p)ppGpp synthetase [Spirochaetaceae bacterium]
MLKQFESYQDAFILVLNKIDRMLRDILILPSPPTCKSRIKSFNSYYRKLLRLKPLHNNDDLPVLTDIMGIRVICAFLEDVSVVEKILEQHFSIVEVERKGADHTFMEFGYESVHILVDIPEEIRKSVEKLPEGLVCEIQIRTILQDAWAEVEHELVYKSEFSPFDLPLKRKLASMNASLSLADIIFQEIRDYQNRLNREVGQRRTSFFDQADELNHMQFSEVFDTAPKKYEEMTASPYVQGTIDDLILEAIHAHNNGQPDRAISIYTQIIEAKPNDIVLSVIYKHRGMAWFAQARYSEALEDFKCSVSCNPNNFQSIYYIGIIYSVLNDEELAIQYYDMSLEKNNFQTHIYYRKALSLYHLGDYSRSMAELDHSETLGLDTEDARKLRRMLIQKMEMN